MIHLCNCTGGSASTISPSKRQTGTPSCKTCCGKSAIGRKVSSSSSLLIAVLELTSLVNSDLTWTRVSKGCRSSSRRPRRSKTVNFAGGKLLTGYSKGLEMPVSESEKLGVSVLGCHFSEKAEHMPIKKRRFLFRTSPPHDTPTPSSDGTERHTTPSVSTQGLQLNPNETCLPTASAAVPGLSRSIGTNNEVDETEMVKACKKSGDNEDFCGISILAAAACSNCLGGEADRSECSGIVSSGRKSLEASDTFEFKEHIVKSNNTSTEEIDSHTSTMASKGVASSMMDASSPDKSTLDNSSPHESALDNSISQGLSVSVLGKVDQEASKTQKSSARDDRLHWDLNIIMDAWEEPFECEHGSSATDATGSNVTYAEDEKHVHKEAHSAGFELGKECGSASKNIGNEVPRLRSKSLANPGISKQLSPEIGIASHVAVKAESLADQHAGSSNTGPLVAFPNNLTLEHPTPGNSHKEGYSRGVELCRERGRASEKMGYKVLPIRMESLGSLEGYRQKGFADISKGLSPEIGIAPHVAVKTESLHYEPMGGHSDGTVAVPSTLTLEHPMRGDSRMEGYSGGFELGKDVGSASKNIGDKVLPLRLGSLVNMGEHKRDGCTQTSKQLSPEIGLAPHVAVKTESVHDERTDSSADGTLVAIPSALTLEYPNPGVSATFAKHSCKSSNNACPEAADTELSVGCSMTAGLNPCINKHASEHSVGFSSMTIDFQNNLDCPIDAIQTVGTSSTRSETKKQNLSQSDLVSRENEANQSGSATNEEDGEASIKIALSCSGVPVEDLVDNGNHLPQETDKSVSKVENKAAFGAFLVTQSSVAAEVEDQPAAVSSKHDGACSEAEVSINAVKSPLAMAAGKSMMLLTGPNSPTSTEQQPEFSNNITSCAEETSEMPLDNAFGHENVRTVSGLDKVDEDKVDELSVGYDSQYEDGELRESSMNNWKRDEGEDGENEYGTDNRQSSLNLGKDDHENVSICGPEGSSNIRLADVGSGRATDVVSSVPLTETLHSSDCIPGSGPNEMTTGQGDSKRQDDVKDASKSDEWKMNVSGCDILSENCRNTSSKFTKVRDFSSRRISYREHKNSTETEGVEIKGEGSRFYRRESPSRIGGPSARDSFLSRGRFRMQGCSSNDADDSTPGHERESGTVRSLRRGRYSPQFHASSRRGDTWNRPLERGRDARRLHSPSYQGPPFRRSLLEDIGSVDNLTKEGSMDQSDAGRPNASSYMTRRSFRSRSPDMEENNFRARLGLRPTGGTSHDRFVNVGRGRSVRYGSRFNGGGPRGRYHGPASDDCGESSIEHSNPFSRRLGCFSPVERRGNPYAHQRSDSRSRSRSRTRSPVGNGGFRLRNSRSPNFRSDARMRRPRSPNYRRGFEGDHVAVYNLGPRNHTSPPPPNSRWVNYKQRSVFDRRSPPAGRIDPPQGERFSFYDSSRKPKQNEYYSSGNPGRFSEVNGAGRGGPSYVGNNGDRTNHGYRRGGFVRRYDMDGPVKRFRFDEEDGFTPGYDSCDKDALEFHGRGNPKSYSNGTDSRFRDFPRRTREERESITGDFQRRPREEKDPSQNERETREEREQVAVTFKG